MSETRRYAIIGCGMMGREHMANLALVPGAELAAIAEPDGGSRDAAMAMAAQLGQSPEMYADATEMLADSKPDAVIIASPNFTHFDVVKPVMEARVAVLLEKPMCTDPADALALAKMAQEYDNLFWVGLEYRYMPPVTKFIERVQSGEAGDIKMLSIREHRFPFLVKVGDWNRFNRNTGGTLVEKCCHFFDLMRHILRDEPVRVYASGGMDVNHLDERYDGETPDILDNAFVMLDFANGARAVLDLCMFAEGSEEQEEISAVGPKGKLEVKLPGGFVTWSPRDKSGPFKEHIGVPPEALAAGDHHGATFYQQRDFHEALVNTAPPLINARDGYRSVLIGAAAQESITTGMPVDIHFEDED